MRSERYERYGEALFMIARDEGKVEEYLTLMIRTEETLKENPELLDVLSSYRLSQSEKNELIEKAFADKACPSFASFLKLLSDHHLLRHFPEIAASFRERADRHLGIEEGIVYSAKPLSKAEISSVEKALGEHLGRKTRLENRVDSRLLGGIKVNVAGKVFDGSIQGKLEGLRKHLLEQGGSV